MESVADEMEKAAPSFGVDPRSAYIAGLYHDLARDLPEETLIRLSLETGHQPDSYERSHPLLLHTYASARLISEEGISDDAELLKAVCEHAVGGTGMSSLSKLLYVTDMSEPLRTYAEAPIIRRLLESGLDAALFKAVIVSIGYIMRSERVIHPATLGLYNELAGGRR